VRALRSRPVQQLLRQVGELLLEPPPLNAPLVEVVTTCEDEGGQVTEFKTGGWLVAERDDTIEVLTLTGGRRRLPRKADPVRGDVDGQMWTFAVNRIKAEELVRRVEQIRAAGDPEHELRNWAGREDPKGNTAGAQEAILAWWLDKTGRQALTARVLFPALATFHRDEDLLTAVRKDLGAVYDQRMIEAFVFNRDYALAERLARGIARLYRGSLHDTAAPRLASELPRRRDDFATLRLPTPGEWERLRQDMPRGEQIDFLCRRLRLLNYENGKRRQAQYAEPAGPRAGPDVLALEGEELLMASLGRTPVINPLVELTVTLRVGLADVPRLALHMREEWCVLNLGMCLDYETTRRLLADVINSIARKDICGLDSWQHAPAAEQGKQIDRIIHWARANAGKSTADLEWFWLEQELEHGVDWKTVGRRIDYLLNSQDRRALRGMHRLMLDARTSAEMRMHLLCRYARHDRPWGRALARHFLDSKHEGLRVIAAALRLPTRDATKARATLAAYLRREVWQRDVEGFRFAPPVLADVIDALLADTAPASRHTAGLLFGGDMLERLPGNERVALLRRCAAAKMVEPYRLYECLLCAVGDRLGTVTFSPGVAAHFAQEIVNDFAADDPEVQAIRKKYPGWEEQLPHLEKWLTGKIAEVTKAGR
jgi:hypothetical protein